MRDQRRAEFVKLAEAMRAAAGYRPDPNRAPVVLALPFQGTWLARNTPARRVPSHGTHFLGQSFAIDFAAVDQRRRTSSRKGHGFAGAWAHRRQSADGRPGDLWICRTWLWL